MNRNLRKLQDQRNLPAGVRFSLRTLLIAVFCCALVLVVLRELTDRFGLVAAFVAVLAMLSVFAHLAGAALGSRYRHAKRHEPVSDSETARTIHEQPMSASDSDFAPATELSRQQPLIRKPIYWAVGIGASVCAILASVILTLFMWDDLAIVNVVFGAVSAAVIGGLLGFWISSFLQVVRSALAEAEKDA